MTAEPNRFIECCAGERERERRKEGRGGEGKGD